MKRFLCLILSFLMVLSMLPAQALAATFTVDSRSDMASSWEEANRNQDSSNTFNMTQDIDMGSQQLNTQSGKTYTINGNGHTISNVDINGVDTQQETVNINASIKSEDHTALEVTGNVDVNVTGNVSNVSNSSGDSNEQVIVMGNGADVSITGNVTSEEGGIQATNADKLLITGSVKLESENGVDPLNHVLDVKDTSVLITGSVTSEEGGLAVRDANVIVQGNVTTNGQSGIQEGSKVQIQGSFVSEKDKTIGQYSGVFVDGSTLQVNKDLDAPLLNGDNDASIKVVGTLKADEIVLGSHSASGDNTAVTAGNLTGNVNAFSDTSVTVNKNAAGDLSVNNGADVTVKGNLIGGINAAGDGASVKVNGNVTTDDPTVVKDGASLHVGGNLKNTSTGTDKGITVMNNSTIYVGGQTNSNQVTVGRDSTGDFGNIAARNVYVGVDDAVDDNTTFNSGTIKCSYKQNGQTKYDGNIYTYGSSRATVMGDVYNSARAYDQSILNVYGHTSNLSAHDNAFAQKHLGISAENVTRYNPTEKTSNDTLVALCKGYIYGSQMYEHCDTLYDIMQDSKGEMLSHLSYGNAVVASVTDWPTVLKNKFFSAGALTQADLASYNSGSLSKLRNAESLNTYHVEVYKSQLADALEEVEGENKAKADRNEIKKIADIMGKLEELETAGATKGMSQAAQKSLKSITKDSELSVEEALKFLVDQGYYSAGDEALNAAARRMSDMYAYKKAMGTAGKTVKAIFTAADFAEYWGTNFEDEVLMLDSMLDNQTLEPEMFVAVAELRKEYANKNYGIAKKVVELVRDKGIDYLGKLAGDLAVVGPVLGYVSLTQTAIEVTAFATGVADDVEARNKGAALSNMLPAAYDNYISAIKNIRNGDDSEEAVQLVENSFLLFKGMLMELNEANLKLCSKSERHIYEYYREMLKTLEAGSVEW